MLLEREDQLAHLRELLDTSTKGAGRGRVAVIRGPVASGKTELLHTFAEQAMSTAGAEFLSATASRSEQAVPLGVLSQLFRSADLPPESAEHVSGLLKEGATSAAFGPDGEADGQLSAYILHSLSLALLDLVERSPGPLLIAIDDVHHADTPSLQCLAAFTRRIRSARVLVVLTESIQPSVSRPRLEAELPREPQGHFLRLDPLSLRGVETVVARHLGPRPAERLASEYHVVTGGNPVLVRGLIDDYIGHGGSDTPRLHVGPAFSEALLSCLYRCDPSMLEVARGIAVLGDAATPALLGELVDLGPDPTLRAIGALNVTGILSSDRFRHPAAAAAVLSGMAPAERTALHARAAQLLYKDGASATSIARQLVAADATSVPGAVSILQEAAEQALADDEVEQAYAYLRAARQRSTEPDQAASTTALLVRAEGRSDPSVALRRVPELAEAVRAGHLAARDLLVPVNWLLWFGHMDASLDALRELAQSSGTLDRDLETRSQLHAARLWLSCMFPAAQPGPRDMVASAAPASAASTANPQVTSPQLQASLIMSAVLAEGPDGTAAADAEQVLQQYRLDERTVAPLADALATLVCGGRLSVAEAWCGPLVTEAAARRAPAWHALFAAIRAEIAWRRGDLPVAEAHARTALTVLPPRSWGLGISLPLSTLLNATTAMGRLEEAAEVMQTPVPDSVFRTPMGLLYLQARGRYHHAIGQFHSAIGDFRTVGELMERWGLDHPALVTWRTDTAQAALCLGDVRGARALAEEQLARCAPGNTRQRAIATRVLAATGDPAKRPELLRQAVEALQTADDRLELAHTLTDLGLAYQALGQYSQARMMLRSGHHLAKSCGAEAPGRTLLPDASGDEASGADRTEPDERWTAKLSDAEHRVAVLAASGYSNRQIARKLFVTVSTVEQHLTRVYRKLQVTKRTDLALKLHPDIADSG